MIEGLALGQDGMQDLGLRCREVASIKIDSSLLELAARKQKLLVLRSQILKQSE